MSPTAKTVIDVMSEIMVRKGMAPPTADEATLNAPFHSFGLDSIEMLDFAMSLEDAFGRTLMTSEMLGCKNLADVIAFAERSQAS